MRKLGVFDDPVRVHEQNGYEFYVTSVTQDLTDRARKMDIHGIELRNWFVYEVRDKDGSRTLVLFDEKGDPVLDSHSMEDMAFKIEVIKMNKSCDNDIVEMAERRNEELNREEVKE